MTDVGVDGYVTARLEAWRRRTDSLLVVLAIGSLPILLLEVERSRLPHSDRLMIDILNVVVLVAFATDFVVELWLASSRPTYSRRE